ncbi:MAG TPA: hypothetical protein DCX06_09545 [Opitutae bacterium]|nr:hypothetical protein [Opitutae bacterium]
MIQRPYSNYERAQSGFALVIALSIMAFVLLLVLSMTILVEVETKVSSADKARLLAKENARLALMLAIGELQKNAGPDQRVTARAEILGDNNFDPAARFWTGVWDTTNPTAAPTWLVSGRNLDPNNLSNDRMQLVGEGSAGPDATQHVFAPSTPVFDQSSNINSRIAWWISDEGIKASAGTLPLNLKEDPNFLSDASVKSLQLQVASTQGLEGIFSKYDRYTSADAQVLDRVNSIKQLLSRADFKEIDADFSSETPFHALTPGSFGVLANTLDGNDGGLLQDLSLYPALLGTGVQNYIRLGEQNADLLGQMNDEVADKRLFTQIQGIDDIDPLNDGEAAMPITPILSNFMIAFTIRSHSPAASNPNFYLRMRFFCEFWNPFTHTLNMRDTNGNNLNLELDITGLPEVTVIKTTGTMASSSPINIQSLTGDPSHPDNAMSIRLENNANEPWLPGRTKNWTGVDATRATGTSPYFSIQNDGKQWNDPNHNLGGSIGIDTGEPRLSADLRHESVGTDTISVKVYLFNELTNSKTLIAQLDGLQYEPVSTRPSGYANTHSGAKFGYHFILRGPHLSTADTEYFRGRWLYDHDPRNPSPSFNPDWNLDNDPTLSSGSAYAPVKDGISPLLLADPAEIYDPGTINTIIFRRFMDRSSGSNGNLYNRLWQDAPLFELPRERILSLAALQHTYFHNERPFQVGNSWGSDGATNTNEWFDRYYFSGMSRSDETTNFSSDAGPSNPALTFYDLDRFRTKLTDWQNESDNDADAAKGPAESLMVANRFNVNSTSVAAWKAVLASLRLNKWEYLDYPEDDTSDLSAIVAKNVSREGTFARFSHSLEETYEAPQTPEFESSEPVAPSAYYRHGARRLDDDQFENLAQSIVNLLKARGEPFQSMEAFLSTRAEQDQSLLEQAIANTLTTNGKQQWDHLWETTGVRGPADDVIDIDHFSPGFLTQADIMTAIGPMLSPRSDTFRIRARSESFSQLGEPLSNATIEATLQRTPEPLTRVSKGGTNRKFKLLSIRWLSEEEI